jgi:hypothetical protein
METKNKYKISETTDNIKLKLNNYNSSKINNELLHRKYIHDIRNMKPLNKTCIDNVYSMSSENKMQLIIAYNAMLESLVMLL